VYYNELLYCSNFFKNNYAAEDKKKKKRKKKRLIIIEYNHYQSFKASTDALRRKALYSEDK
jgi:hypothetical protein